MIARAALLGLVLVTALLAETVVFAELSVAGYAPAVVTLTVVGIGLARGAEAGARYGFAAGLATDLVAGGLLGLHAMILVLAGWGTGAVRPYLTGPPVVAHVLVGGLTSAATVLAYGVLAFVLDPGSVVVAELARAATVTGLYSAALAPVVVRPVTRLAHRAASTASAGRQ